MADNKKYIRITRYEKTDTPQMFKKVGSYVQPYKLAMTAMDGELGNSSENNIGDSVHIEVIEMTDEEYSRLPEFEGY